MKQTLLAFVLVLLLSVTAFAFEIGHERTLVVEHDAFDGFVLGYESILTIKFSDHFMIGAATGPEYKMRYETFGWSHDVFVSFSKWVVGVNLGRPSGTKTYIMYTF